MNDTQQQLKDIYEDLKTIDKDPESLELERLQHIENQTEKLKDIFEKLSPEEQAQHHGVLNEIIQLTESLIFQTQVLEEKQLQQVGQIKNQKRAENAYGKMHSVKQGR